MFHKFNYFKISLNKTHVIMQDYVATAENCKLKIIIYTII